jgi:N6-L-threonylcarbamoyladenine synthase
MRVLSIETSCDETAIAILDCTGDVHGATFTVVADALYSQAHLHAEYGGVYPTLAKREHNKNLPLLLEQALAKAKAFADEKSGRVANIGDDGNPRTFHAADAETARELGIELITVTQGPGLEPALWEGIEFAKKLGIDWGVPVVGADHMEGHIVSGLVTMPNDTTYSLEAPTLPLLALLISGGHTELILMREWFTYELIGKTKDDAIGEAFDKVARLLGLPYPGGPQIDTYAAAARNRGASKDTHGIVFPRPLIHETTCNFSFSGLKTAVLYKLRDMPKLDEDDKEHIAQAFQDAARDVVVSKTARAIDQTAAKTLVVGGGVSANQEIRTALKTLTDEYADVRLALPHKTLTGDNALMIGMAAYLRHTAGLDGRPLTADGSQSLA